MRDEVKVLIIFAEENVIVKNMNVLLLLNLKKSFMTVIAYPIFFT
jgi:hypothetical protein